MEKAPPKKHIFGDEDLFTTELIQDFEPSPGKSLGNFDGERVDELSHFSVDLKPKCPATKSEDTEITGQSNTETKTSYFQKGRLKLLDNLTLDTRSNRAFDC